MCQQPAQAVQWDNVMRHSRVIVAGDMNAHSLMWNPKAGSRQNAVFWENLITEHALVIWNSEEATRMGARASNHSIIDLTLTSPSLELKWRIAQEEEATGSDHEVIVWEVPGRIAGSQETSKETTGWDVSGWDRSGKSEEGQAAAQVKRAVAQQCFLRAVGKTAVLDDTSSKEQVEAAVVALREAMVGTLDEHARKKRWCSRSKPWWTDDIAVLRKEFGRER